MSHISPHETGENVIPNVTEFWYLHKNVVLRIRATMVREITCLPKVLCQKYILVLVYSSLYNIYRDGPLYIMPKCVAQKETIMISLF